jgi:hypothetical protein
MISSQRGYQGKVGAADMGEIITVGLDLAKNVF